MDRSHRNIIISSVLIIELYFQVSDKILLMIINVSGVMTCIMFLTKLAEFSCVIHLMGSNFIFLVVDGDCHAK